MKITAAGLTDKGRARANNEDNFYAGDGPFFVVADGVGGHLAGETASRMAVDIIGGYMKTGKEAFLGEYDRNLSDGTNRVASGIRLANQAIYEASSGTPALSGMASTVVAAIVTGSTLGIAHVGDSRAYLIRAGAILPLTEDHSVVQEQVRGGLLTAEEARKSKMRNIVTRALGKDHTVEVDSDEVPLMDGDRVLLCTDGLTEMVTEEDILSIILSSGEPRAACKELIDAANGNGGKDNITAVLIYLSKRNLYYYLKRLFGFRR